MSGAAAISGHGRVETLFAEGNNDELYILLNSGVMIRQVLGLGSRDT